MSKIKVWAEYIWLGGVEEEKRVKTLRSKGRVVEVDQISDLKQANKLPEWAYTMVPAPIRPRAG